MFTHPSLDFQQLLKEEAFLDCVLLTTDGRSVKAHSSVLGAISPYLKSVLNSHELFDETCMTLVGFRHEDVLNFINFVYSGECILKNEEANGVINILDFFQVPFNGDRPSATDSEYIEICPDHDCSLVDSSKSEVSARNQEEDSNDLKPVLSLESETEPTETPDEELPVAEVAPTPVVANVPTGPSTTPVVIPNLNSINTGIKYALVPCNPGPLTPVYLVADLPDNLGANILLKPQQDLEVGDSKHLHVGGVKRPVTRTQTGSVRKRNVKKIKFESDSENLDTPRKALNTRVKLEKSVKLAKKQKMSNLPMKEEIIRVLQSEIAEDTDTESNYPQEIRSDSPNWGFDSDGETGYFNESDDGHPQSSPGEELEKCPKCFRKFAGDMLEDHVLRCTGRKAKYSGEHPCPICKKHFSTKMSARRHAKDVHGQLISYRRPPKEEEKIEKGYETDRAESRKKPESFMCDLCGFWANTEAKMQDHMNFHTGARPYLCEICSNTFLTRSALSSHRKHHRKGKDAERKCPLCDLVFYSESTYGCHMRRHKTDPDYKPVVTGQFYCRFCKKKFSSRLAVKLHEQRAHRDTGKSNDENVCSVCKESFENRFSLEQHMNEHRNYECSYCHKLFVTEWAMRTHQRFRRCAGMKKGIAYVPEPSVKRNVKCKSCEECFSSAEYREHKNGHCRGYPDPSRAVVRKRVRKYPKGWTPWEDFSKKEKAVDEESAEEEEAEEPVEEEGVVYDDIDEEGVSHMACVSV